MTDAKAIYEQMISRFNPEKAQGVNAVIQFDLSGDNGGQFWVKIADGNIDAAEGQTESPNITIRSSMDTWLEVASGKANVISAFMMGRLKVQGDMGLGIKMQSMFGL